MLKTLKIKNFAIIDDMDVAFDNGFSVIIGETGTGKSIIIEAINLILGARATNSMIRSGCEKSFLQAEFEIDDVVKVYLDSIDIDCDATLEITRILNVNGKSSYKINGNIVTLATINSVRDLIIEIKRQSDNEISNDEFFAIKLIDQYANIEQNSDYKEYLVKYNTYENLLNKINSIKNVSDNIDIEYVKMQLNRIEKLSTYDGEYEELIEKSKRAGNTYKISELGEKLKNSLSSMYDLTVEVKSTYDEFKSVGGDDCGDYNEISIQLEDFVNSFTYTNEEVSENELEVIEERIYSIKKLYEMYGGTYNDVTSAYEDLNEQVFQYENSEQLLEKYEHELSSMTVELNDICSRVNEHRHTFAIKMCEIVRELLCSMYMEDAAIEFSQQPCEFNKYGNINLNLLVSTNNNSFLPVNEIASGGEKARIILALKKVIVDNSIVSTIIFDEIDTGVSGRVAKAMGKVMCDISAKTQVIAITHLPQVAAISQHCLVVEKSKEDQEVVSNITKVDDEQKVLAIAKILSGDIVTQEAISNARSLIIEN